MTSHDAGNEAADNDDTDSPDDIDNVDSDAPDNPDDSAADVDRSVIRAGRNFEATYRLDASEAGEFLIALGRQLRDADELTLADDEWELPFAFGEPVELEVDFDGMDDPELEIELELPGRTDETAPDVT